MANLYEGPVQRLIDEFNRLPGIGPKSAQRIAYYLLKIPAEDAYRLAKAVSDAKEHVRWCDMCFNFAEEPLCNLCADPRRDVTTLCAVEEPRDVVAIERTQEYMGLYHVLGGAISPLDGIGPEQLRISELLNRVSHGTIKEVIIATNPNIEGEATAMYIAKLLGPIGIKVSRLASGLPVGGDLEYADEVTLGRALEDRKTIEG